jgi:uncharacterized protein (TIGR04255 family)
VGQPIPPEILQILSMGVLDNSYRFVTEDRKTTIILVAESISLSTTDYKDWSEFKKMFGVAFDALMAIYKPSYFTRVGLRYTNAIDRSMLELASTPWSQLLRPEIIGELALPQFENSLEAVKHMLRLKTNEGSVTLQHGTAIVQGHSEQCYTLDCDFSSSQKTVADDVQPLLAQFNDRAFRAFRWCITDTLHRALGPMDPNPVSGV